MPLPTVRNPGLTVAPTRSFARLFGDPRPKGPPRLARGDPSGTEERPAGRTRETKKLLTAAVLIMSVFLVSLSFLTTLLIPPDAFESGGAANGRAPAYLAHAYLGNAFGTVYDFSTIAILWFAGASAMAGLLNLMPRYLPRYGTAPHWAAAVRPMVIVFIKVTIADPSEFKSSLTVRGKVVNGRYRVLTLESLSDSNALAAFLLHARDLTGPTPTGTRELTSPLVVGRALFEGCEPRGVAKSYRQPPLDESVTSLGDRCESLESIVSAKWGVWYGDCGGVAWETHFPRRPPVLALRQTGQPVIGLRAAGGGRDCQGGHDGSPGTV